MLPVQGPAQDPSSFVVLIIALAVALIVWWRVAVMIIAIGLLVMLGLGAMAFFHDMHHAVH
jgi:hypothetical protein